MLACRRSPQHGVERVRESLLVVSSSPQFAIVLERQDQADAFASADSRIKYEGYKASAPAQPVFYGARLPARYLGCLRPDRAPARNARGIRRCHQLIATSCSFSVFVLISPSVKKRGFVLFVSSRLLDTATRRAGRGVSCSFFRCA